MDALETYLRDIQAIASSGPGVAETSYYPALANLLNEIGRTVKPAVKCIINPHNTGAGIPTAACTRPTSSAAARRRPHLRPSIRRAARSRRSLSTADPPVPARFVHVQFRDRIGAWHRVELDKAANIHGRERPAKVHWSDDRDSMQAVMMCPSTGSRLHELQGSGCQPRGGGPDAISRIDAGAADQDVARASRGNRNGLGVA
jgi:hypothetical protein